MPELKPTTYKETLEQAIQKVDAQTGQLYAHTMVELFDDLTILQEFAKALWGEEKQSIDTSGDYTPKGMLYISKRGLQYHLQMMVIAPIR